MQPMNSLQERKQKKGFAEIVNQTNFRAMIDKSIGNPARAAAFVSTLISVVNSNHALKQCDPNSIVSAALRGEIGMGLSLALGEYAIIPYNSTAQFQLQVNCLKRIAIRSGQYAKVGFFDVRQGEYKGRDRMTREPIIEWIEDDDAREALPIVGYYGFYILSGDYNGFSQTIYWTHEQILKHAGRYSKAFDLTKYRRILAGDFDDTFTMAEAKKLQQAGGGSPWYANPDELPHMKMCLKTIAKQLLGDGLAPKEVVQIIEEDDLTEKTGEPVYYADNDFLKPQAAEPQETEQVKEEEPLPVIDAEIVEEPKKAAAPARKPVKKTEPKPEPEPAPSVAEAADADEYDPAESFFL